MGTSGGPGFPGNVAPPPRFRAVRARLAAVRERLTRVFKAFTYRDFRLLWAGAFTSSVGTWMQTVAQNWLILTMTGSASLLGFAAFLQDTPFLLFSLFGGVLADRMDRRRIPVSYTHLTLPTSREV